MLSNLCLALAGPDYLSQLLQRPDLGWKIILAGMLVAIWLGGLHALEPGHGKTLVAAYLVGARGTVKHALFLGGMVTFTHTITVFALGFVTLFLSRYVMPDKLYPILGSVSGITIVWIGAALLVKRIRILRHGHSHDHHHHDHDHDHHHIMIMIITTTPTRTYPKATSPWAASSLWVRAAAWCLALPRWCCCSAPLRSAASALACCFW